MKTHYEKYIQLVKTFAEDFAEKGYSGVTESDVRNHYSNDDLYEIAGLYLNTLPTAEKVEYLINSDNIFSITDKVCRYMSSPVSFFNSNAWSKTQGRKDAIVNSICSALVEQTISTVIRDVNDSIPFSIESREFSFQQLMTVSSEQYHNL